MELILIRHGETAWNAEHRLQGHTDVGLSEQGQFQAEALGRALAREAIDVIISSDLQRAQTTAQAIAHHHDLRVICEPLLRERCYGVFEGLRYEEIEARYPAEYAAWQRRDIDSVMPSGTRVAESFRQFNERILAAIGAQQARYGNQRVVIVAHGGVLECAYRAANAIPLSVPRTFSVLNASINRFQVDDDALHLSAWGDVAHLGGRVIEKYP